LSPVHLAALKKAAQAQRSSPEVLMREPLWSRLSSAGDLVADAFTPNQ
jgi:hypothetical protein